MPRTEKSTSAPARPDEEREYTSASVVALTAKLAAREAALLEAGWRAEELAAALDGAQAELVAIRSQLENAEETLAVVSEIADAAQATIDKLRAEIVSAEAQASQVARQPPLAAAGEPFASARLHQRQPVESKGRDGLAWTLIHSSQSLPRWRIPRLRFKRAKPSLITLADRARDAGQWEQAARHYRKALRRNPHNSPIWVQYGHALKEAGHVAEAEAAYRKAAELDPKTADPHLQLGHVLKLQRRRNEAVAAYLRALDLDPTLRGATLELVALGWTRHSARPDTQLGESEP